MDFRACRPQQTDGPPSQPEITFFMPLMGLAGTLLIFNEREADILISIVPETYAGLDGDMPFRDEAL